MVAIHGRLERDELVHARGEIFHPADEIYAGNVAVKLLVHSLQSQQMRQGGGAGRGTFALPPESCRVVSARQCGAFRHHKTLCHTVTVDYAPC